MVERTRITSLFIISARAISPTALRRDVSPRQATRSVIEESNETLGDRFRSSKAVVRQDHAYSPLPGLPGGLRRWK